MVLTNRGSGVSHGSKGSGMLDLSFRHPAVWGLGVLGLCKP